MRISSSTQVKGGLYALHDRAFIMCLPAPFNALAYSTAVEA